MFSLVNINNLPTFLTVLDGTEYFMIDVPDVASPTGFTSYKVTRDLFTNPNFERFLQLYDTPNTFPAEGLVPAINSALTSLEWVEMSTTYHSGWKPMPLFNGSYGLANTGNVNFRPQVRVDGRNVTISGLLQLPEPTVAGGSILDTNGSGYVLQSKTFSELYTGVGGWGIDAKEIGITINPILPTALLPSITTRDFSGQTFLTKTKNITGGRMRLTTFLNSSGILADGRLFLTGIEASERNGDTGTGWNKMMHLRKSIDRFNTGDKLMNYDNYRNAFDNLGLDTLRVPNVEGYTLEYDFDGSKVSTWGGFFIQMNTQYTISDSITDAQIKTAFDSL